MTADRDRPRVRIDHPVLADASPRVQIALQRFVARPRARRENLDDDGRSPADVLFSQNPLLIGQDHEQVWLNHVMDGDDDVEGRVEHFAGPGSRTVRAERREERSGQPLVPDRRRRRHEVLPIDELVPAPVVWEAEEVVVGELESRGWSHLVPALHRPPS